MNENQSPERQRKPAFIILSVLGLIYGAHLLWNIIGFTSAASETQGRIITRDNFTFTIQYTVNGKTFQITEDLPSTKGMSGMKRMKLQPGSTVTVLYDPSSPGNAKWNANRNWVFPLAVIFVSLLAGFAGLFPDIALRSFDRNKDT